MINQTMLSGFRNHLIKTAAGEYRIAKITPIMFGLAGLGSGAASLAISAKGQKERQQYAKATTGAIQSLAGEAMRARGERMTLGKALAINTQADMISRRVLADAITKNFEADAARVKGMAKIHGVKTK